MHLISVGVLYLFVVCFANVERIGDLSRWQFIFAYTAAGIFAATCYFLILLANFVEQNVGSIGSWFEKSPKLQTVLAHYIFFMRILFLSAYETASILFLFMPGLVGDEKAEYGAGVALIVAVSVILHVAFESKRLRSNAWVFRGRGDFTDSEVDANEENRSEGNVSSPEMNWISRNWNAFVIALTAVIFVFVLAMAGVMLYS